MNSIEQAEQKIAAALRAMFYQPGTQSDIDARSEYIKFKIEDSKIGKDKRTRTKRTR